MNKTHTKEQELKILISEKHPELLGTINIHEASANIVVISGEVSGTVDVESSIKTLAEQVYEGYLISCTIKTNTGLNVMSDSGLSHEKEDGNLDEVKVVYRGLIDTNLIKSGKPFKILNEDILDKTIMIHRVLGFLAPIVLNKDLEIIDGELRYNVAIHEGVKQMDAVIIDDSGVRADFLRLALNRTAEFQRWEYENVDNYVDSVPQAQPLLEPLGFFGKLVLPTSFFTNTVVQYYLDEYNEQQQLYRQETGVAQWAKIMRERKEIEDARKLKARTKKPVSAVSLFDLSPKAEDFVETHDIDEALVEHQEKYRKVAEAVTESYDEERRPILEARGSWQGTRRTSTEKAADLRDEAENEDLTIEED